MRPADRLFQIIVMLRHGRIVTARRLAEALEVSERTIYRDIADLIRAGAPIDGEAGIGYRLRRGYQVPPLMFTADELAALAIGAKFVRAWTDTVLGKAAESAIARIEAVLPRELEERIAARSQRYLAPDFMQPVALREPMAILREGLERGRKVKVAYRRAMGKHPRLVTTCLCQLGGSVSIAHSFSLLSFVSVDNFGVVAFVLLRI